MLKQLYLRFRLYMYMYGTGIRRIHVHVVSSEELHSSYLVLESELSLQRQVGRTR